MNKLWRVSLVLVFGLMLAAGWLLGANAQVMLAAAGVRYVAPDGNDSATCGTIADRCATVQRAVDVAATGDEIRVAAGTYTGTGSSVAVVSKTVTLLGGWNSSFTTRAPETNHTILDGQRTGSVVALAGTAAPTVDGFTITGGKAADGGGIVITSTGALIQNNVITGNVTIDGSYEGGRGGGIFISYSTDVIIRDNAILSNTSGYGGGIYHIGSTGITVTQNTVIDNYASHRAGGMLIERPPDLVQGNVFRANSAAQDGGAFLIWDAAPRIDGNRIISNTANVGGGISMGNGATAAVTNNLLVGNTNDGILIGHSSPVIVNNTIVGPGVSGSGDGIDLGGHLSCGGAPYCNVGTYLNNIVTGYEIGIVGREIITPVIDYNNVWNNLVSDYRLPAGVTPGAHALSADPLFADPGAGDYHLTAGSPMIDAGDPAGAPPAPLIDIDGDLRPMGSGVDIGADEFVATRLYLPLVQR